MRDDPDRIEEEGIRRARVALKSADAVLWIQDATEAVETEMGEDVADGVETIVVRNKIDLLDKDTHGTGDETGFVHLSAKTGEGVDALQARLRELAGYRNLGEGAFTARQRHIDALGRAARHFAVGRKVLEEARAGELLAEELRLAQDALGEVTGAVSSDDLLGRIFSSFCIGK
jgi:tRNA modification GTPase